MSDTKTIFCGNNPQYLSEELVKQSNSSNGGVAFRIPSLVNANGTLVAAVDNAATGADWGYISVAVRTSEDGGKSWSDINTIVSPPARIVNSDINNIATAFYIDPCMSVASNGDIVMLVTFWPESKGLHNLKYLDKNKPAYASFNGNTYPIIYDKDGNFFYVLDDETVLDSNKAKTKYRVNFAEGELYKGDEYIGNIHLNGAIGKSHDDNITTTHGAPLKSVRRSYIFMIKSSDNGKSWSKPVDITGSILNEKTDGPFLGVAPGSAPKTKDGRIIFPLYTLKGSVCIYSDDNGETWRRGQWEHFTPNIDEWTLVEAPQGELLAFSRAKRYAKTPFAISYDNSITWIKEKKAPFKAPKCQKNALIIDDRIFVSHPSATKRANGVISTGKVIYKKDMFSKIKWDKESIKVNDGFFAYSCMAKIDDKTIGILYEDQPSSHIVFQKIKI